VTLTNVRLSDPDVPSILCPSALPIAALAPDAELICTGAYSITEADIAARKKDNTATVESDQTSPITASATVPLPARLQPPPQVVQFIAPISVYREEGLFEPEPVEPMLPQWIEGYVWHDLNVNRKWEQGEQGREGWWVFLDLNENGVWDAFDPEDPDASEEPFAVTDANGRFVIDVEPGTYQLRVDVTNLGLSDGAFPVLSFPGSDGHEIEVKAGEPVIGVPGPSDEPTIPNIGVFVYSPFVRPADQHHEYATHPESRWNHALPALEPWQSFKITNTTGSAFEITEIRKEIDTTKTAVADQFVTVALYRKATNDDDLKEEPWLPVEWLPSEPQLQVPVSPGEIVQFFAFYDPAIREGDRVLEQYPDWYGAKNRTHPAHTFARGDHLSVMTDTDATFRVDLVGGSTYDSDIVYDGAIDSLDARRLNDDLLNRAWPIPEGVSSLFDPSSDVNARCPNGADAVLNTCAWPLDDVPRREIGLGDFGPLNVEWNRARAPFLDLDPDNSSGARGVDYRAEFQGDPVEIADRDAAFANSIERDLVSLVAEIRGEADGDRLYVDEAILAALGITADGTNGTSRLVLAGPASVDDYAAALREIKFQSDSLASRTVEIEIRAIGSDLGAPGSRFTDVEGNIALSTIILTPPEDSNITGATDFDAAVMAEPEWAGESPTSYTHVPAVMAVAARNASDGSGSASSIKPNGWQNAENRYEVNGNSMVTPLDVLLIVNYLDANPADTDLPLRAEDAPPYLDVNGDGHSTALDALLVINHLTAEEMSVAEGEAVGAITESPRAERLFKGPDAQLATPGIPQQEIVQPTSGDREQDWQRVNDSPGIVVPTEADAIVPVAVVEQPSAPMTLKRSVADDAFEYSDAPLLNIEGLLTDLVDDIAAAGL
jgi:hypothetical protein